MAVQDLRSFVAAYEHAHPGEVTRVTDPVALEVDVMALVLEYERRRRYPILFFEQGAGQGIPIVSNVRATDTLLSELQTQEAALKTLERRLAEASGQRVAGIDTRLGET